MCRVDSEESDFTEIILDKQICAPWKMRCDDCHRVIQVGEYYNLKIWGTYWDLNEKEEWDDTPNQTSTSRTCAHCLAAGRWLDVVCGGHMWPGVVEELEEHWSIDPEYHSLGLGRILTYLIAPRMGSRRDKMWRRNGELVPVEKVQQWVIDALASHKRRGVAH